MICSARLAVTVSLVALVALPASAQQAMRGLLAPVGQAESRFELLGELDGGGDAGTGGEGDSSFASVSAVVPLARSTTSEWTLSASASVRRLDFSATLPDSGERMPDELWDLDLSLGHKRLLENGRTAGVFLGAGSASDEPFASTGESTVSATAYLRVPRRPGRSWLLFVNYSNNRGDLDHVPLPGVAYLYQPSRRFGALVGVPMLAVWGQSSERAGYRLSYFPLHEVEAELTWRLGDRWRLRAGAEWRDEPYLRAGRRDEDDRLTLDEKRAGLGLAVSLGAKGSLELTAGHAFDRFFYEGEGYDDRDRNRVELEDAAFVTLAARWPR